MANYFSGRVFVLCVGNYCLNFETRFCHRIVEISSTNFIIFFSFFQKIIFSAKSPTEEVAEAEASGEIAYEGGGEAEAEASRPQYTPEEAEAKNGEEVEIEGYEG